MQEIRAIRESDHPVILRLNDAEVQQTSPMDAGRLQSLLALAAYSRVLTVDGEVAAFLIAMQDGAPYENDNFAWFASRLPRFLYVDRVVVDAGCAGRGLGSRLYEDLFQFARAQGIATIACEYNLQPPNPASRLFHDKFGFRELGTQWVAGGTKHVSLQAADVGEPIDPEALLRRYLAAYARKDIDTVAAMLAPAVRLQDWNLAAAGKAAVLHETQKNFDAAASLDIDVRRVMLSGERSAAGELRIVIDGSTTLEVVDVLTFDYAGQITAIRAYKG